MITNLHIKNIGIIEDIEIDFYNGLNVLTGETGAGKSLIIGSLNIISGGRFSKDMIRKGETNSFVEICFFDPENKHSIDGNIIVSREISLNGKNMCKINGRMVTVNELKEFMKNIIEIHGQNDSQNLLDSKEHIKFLDSFIGDDIKNLKNEYKKDFVKYNEIKKELKENLGDDKERQRQLDLLKYQLNEIEVANLVDGEEEELENKVYTLPEEEKEFEIKHPSLHHWDIVGDKIIKFYRMTNISTDEGMMKLLTRLRKLKIDDLLEEMGAEDGDVVTLDDFTFEYYK